MYHRIIHPLAGGTALCMVLSLGCAGTSVQPGQRGLMWRPFTEELSNEPLKDGFIGALLGMTSTCTIFAGKAIRKMWMR